MTQSVHIWAKFSQNSSSSIPIQRPLACLMKALIHVWRWPQCCIHCCEVIAKAGDLHRTVRRIAKLQNVPDRTHSINLTRTLFLLQSSHNYWGPVLLKAARTPSGRRPEPCDCKAEPSGRWRNNRVGQFRPIFQVEGNSSYVFWLFHSYLTALQLCRWKFSHNESL